MTYHWAQFMECAPWAPGTVLVIPSDVPMLEHYLMVEFADLSTGMQYALHNVPQTGVARLPLADALKGKRPRVHWRPQTPEQGMAVIGRMQSLLGGSYRAVESNCEHAVIWAITGKWESAQVNNVLVGALIAGATAIVLSRRR